MSDYNPPPLKPSAPGWQVFLFGLAFGLLYLVWAFGFDFVTKAMSGGMIESALNWLTGMWFWAVIIFFVIGMTIAAFVKRSS